MQSKQKKLSVPNYKGMDTAQILALPTSEVGKYSRSRIARKISRGFSKPQLHFVEKVRKAQLTKQKTGKAKVLKTHCRNMCILPEMIGLTIAVHNGKVFTPIDVKQNMLGQYLGEFAQSYKMVKHGKAGVGSTRGSSAVSLK